MTPTPPSAGPPIGPSARAHGISDQRIWEAYRDPVAEFVVRNGVTIRLGYDSQANLLEIGWINRGRGRRIIHAMVCRAAWRQEYGCVTSPFTNEQDGLSEAEAWELARQVEEMGPEDVVAVLRRPGRPRLRARTRAAVPGSRRGCPKASSHATERAPGSTTPR